MGQYNKAVLTTAGENLIARALAGEIELNITKAKTSSYTYPSGTDFKSLTDMKEIKQAVENPTTTVYNDKIIQTRVLFSNEEIDSTYYIHNIGLYVMDGTQEVLFCIVTADIPDEMPQYNGVATTSYIYNIQNVVQNAAELNITVNPSGTATIQDVSERVDATGGDISETVIKTLDNIEDKYPMPGAEENVKRFFGKVLTFLKNIRPLTENINIYVSTTGSDIMGDGSQLNPFKTIQHAIDILPKDFGEYYATIQISGGTYNEDLLVAGFNGTIQLTLSGNVTMGSITIANSRLICAGTSACLLTIKYLYVTASGRFDSFSNISITTTGYILDQPMNSNKASIAVNRGDVYISGPITLTGNTDVGMSVISISRMYFSIVSGSGFNVGIVVSTGSMVNCGAVNNISATIPIQQTGGSRYIYPNGTQITGLISSGLSCTWGVIRGGYYRNGNQNGVAEIIVQIRLTLTADLTANNTYLVTGFPSMSMGGGDNVIAVATNRPQLVNHCYMTPYGTITFIPGSNIPSSQGGILFNCSYVTM